jgi:hypothetical protein
MSRILQPQSRVDSAEIRRLLFDAARALPEAQAYFEGRTANSQLLKTLFEIAIIDSSDTIRLQACYAISRFPEQLLRDHEDDLLRLQAEEWESLSDHAIVALAKLRSKRSLMLLIEKRLAPKLPWESEILRRHLRDVLGE